MVWKGVTDFYFKGMGDAIIGSSILRARMCKAGLCWLASIHFESFDCRYAGVDTQEFGI